MEITKEEILNEWLRQTNQSNIKEGHRQVILEAMEEYADAKCKSMVSSSNVSSGMTELKKAVGEKLEHYKGLIGSPDYPHRIEQNACECLVRELTYLNEIVEYES